MRGRCFYCGGEMLRRGKRGRRSHRGRTDDHLIPLSRGGLEVPENLVTCHQRCNQKKGNRTLEEYRVIVAAEKGIPPAEYKFPGEQI